MGRGGRRGVSGGSNATGMYGDMHAYQNQTAPVPERPRLSREELDKRMADTRAKNQNLKKKQAVFYNLLFHCFTFPFSQWLNTKGLPFSIAHLNQFASN